MAFRITKILTATLSAGALWHGTLANASEIQNGQNSLISPPQTRLIVKWKKQTGNSRTNMALLNHWVGTTPLKFVRTLANGSQIFKVNQDENDTAELVKTLAKNPQVAYVEADPLLHIAQIPNDPRYNEQWDLQEGPGGMNLPLAWDTTVASKDMVVAVVDTGILPHADLTGKILPGYDFISDAFVGNDGDERDPDATDPGDWIKPFDCGFLQWNTRNSSWHGTHVSGTIGAHANNAEGIAGIAWNAKILPVRVLGKCGGYMTDIADGMRWAAGIPVEGIPNNPFPARVINLSLGGPSPCSQTMVDTINEINQKGTVVVVAAGNESRNAATSTPANCPGVITVAANSREGGLSFYSNFGKTIEITAPGGDKKRGAANGILSTINEGLESPAGDSFGFYQGTSMATPHVAGAVALILSVNPSLTPTQVTNVIQQTARSFPVGVQNACSTADCGPGILDATAAVNEAARLAEMGY